MYAGVTVGRRQLISSFNEDVLATARTRESLPGFSLEEAEGCRSELPEVHRVLSYFEERTGGKRFACRADIEPGQLKDILPDVCIMTPEFDPAGVLEDVTVRLMGTNVVSFYGEMTGKSVFMHPSPEVSDRIFKSIAFCLEHRKPIVTQAYTLSEEKNYLRVLVMYVPLSENNRDIDRFFLHVAVRRSIAH